MTLQRSYQKLFASSDGQAVLAHLRQVTRNRVLGPDSSADALRYLEGQRALVARIEALADRTPTSFTHKEEHYDGTN